MPLAGAPGDLYTQLLACLLIDMLLPCLQVDLAYPYEYEENYSFRRDD